MSVTEVRYLLAEAEEVAQALVRMLEASCERIVIAGSIRRGKADVGDIELLCIPKLVRREADLFGIFTTVEDALDTHLQNLIQGGTFQLRPNIRGRMTYGPKNKLLIHVPSGIPLDVFTATEANWGMGLFVRTGPAEWNVRAMARFRQLGMAGHAYGGVTDAAGNEIDCPSEETVFRLLGWSWTPPEERR